MSLCKKCGEKVGNNDKFCFRCGNSISEIGENRVSTSIETSGAKLKNLFSGIQNTVKEVGKNMGVSSKVNSVIKKFAQELSDEQLDLLMSFYILDFPVGEDEKKVGIYDFFVNIKNKEYFKVFIQECDAINKDDIIEFYNSSLFELLEQIRGIDNFDEYYTEESSNRIAKDMYKQLLDLSCEETRVRLENVFGGGRKDSFQLINEIGFEKFYSPRYMFFHAISNQFFFWRKYMQNFDENTIGGVRQYLLREIANEMTRDVEKKAEVQLHNGTPVCIWRNENLFCMLVLDNKSIVSIKQRNELKELSYRQINIEDIIYYKVKGEYHRDQKLSGGGTNVFLSQSTISKGNYTNEIKSETVVTDTRYVVMHTKEKDYNFSYDSLDGLKDIIPEKDNDIVSEIKKQNIINGERQVERKDKQIEKVSNSDSDIDEIMKYKKLFDNGILTQEEFEAKKKQILGI